MPFLPLVVMLAWQAISRSASFALGWATAIYFGQVPGRQGSILAVASLASAAWVIVVAGFAAPLVVGAVLDAAGIVGRNFSVAPAHALVLGAVVLIGPPAVAGATVWGEFHDDRSPWRWLRMIPGSYPAAGSLGLGVIQMVVFTPAFLVQRLVRKQALLQAALSMRADADDDELTGAVARALNSIGIERISVDAAPALMAWPMRTVGYAAEHLVGAVVRGRPMRLRADGLQLFAYATNVAVLGPSEEAHRARAALLRELPFGNARITWSSDARDLEDAIMAAHGADAGDRTRLRRRLDAVQQQMDAADLQPDEWNLLYRLRLQVEQMAAEPAGGYRAKVRMAKPATMTKATNTTTSRATQLTRRSG